MRLLRFTAALSLLALALPAFGQATQDVRLRVLSNDATNGGNLVVAVEIRTMNRAPNNTFASGTVDIAYDPAQVAAPTYDADDAFDFASGYFPQFTATLSDGATTYARIGYTPLFPPGTNVSDTFTPIGTLTFVLTAAGADDVDLNIRRGSLSLGYHDDPGNFDGDGVIEDNTGTGPLVVPIVSVGDLTASAFQLITSEGWRMLAPLGDGLTLDDLLGSLWTQGFPGADAAGGTPNVYVYDEAAGWMTPGNQSDPIPVGTGVLIYVYGDDDNDGSDDGFPKRITNAADPLLDLASPVNAVMPNPYVPDFPFDFGVAFTSGSGNPDGEGWNFVGNPLADGMDWDAAGWTKTNMDNVIYLLDPFTGTYLTWNGVAGSIPGASAAAGVADVGAVQGFWVKANAVSPSLIADADALASGGFFTGRTGAPLAERQDDEAAERRARSIVLGFRVDADDETVAPSQAHIAFSPDGDFLHDIYDAYALYPLAAQHTRLYSVAADDREGNRAALSINTLPLRAFARERAQIHLAFEATTASDEAGTYTLTWPELRNLPDNAAVFLMDHETGAVIDLRRETDYTFTQGASAARPAPEQQTATAATRQTEGRERTQDSAATPVQRIRASDAPRFTLRFTPPGDAATGATAADAPATANSVIELPTEPALHTAYPNPFTSSATLRYDVAETGPVSLVVYDALGRVVARPVDGTIEPGRYAATFDGGTLASGLYIVRMTTGTYVQTQRLTLVR